MHPFLAVQLPSLINWIPGKIKDWSAWKPAIRCAVTGWICLVLFLIVPIARSLGQAAFFVIIVSILYPPSSPTEIAMEQLFTMLIMVACAWLWGVIAAAIAEAVRVAPSPEVLASYANQYPGTAAATVASLVIFDGAYLSTPSSCVYAVFLGFGSAFFIYLKAYNVKLALPAVLSCILLDIICSYGALIPGFANVAPLGRLFFFPMSLYVAVALLVSCIVFPQSVQDRFLTMLVASLENVKGVTMQQNPLLATSPFSPEWAKFRKIGALRGAAQMAHQGMMLGKPSLTREFCFGRLRGRDLQDAESKIRRLIWRMGGLHTYYELVTTWVQSYHEANKGLSTELSSQENTAQESVQSATTGNQVRQPLSGAELRTRVTSAAEINGRKKLALFGRETNRKQVGIFESVRYMNVESLVFQPREEENMVRMTAELGPACKSLLDACCQALETIAVWFTTMNEQRLLWRLGAKETKLFNHSASQGEKPAGNTKTLSEIMADVQSAIADFKDHRRKTVFEPYRQYFEKVQDSPGMLDSEYDDLPVFEGHSHRGLFYAMLYQFQLSQYASAVEELLAFVEALDNNLGPVRLQWPRFKGIVDIFHFTSLQEGGQDDEDPEEIAGMRLFTNEVEATDPDAGRPENPLQWVIRAGSRFIRTATRGNVWFAIRAGIITVLVTLPQYFPSSASFFYYNRGLWAIIMAQLTFQRWTGDTLMQYFFRVVVTFGGAVLGMILWYIGSGSSVGNPYGIAAIAAVTYPFLFFYRVNIPIINIVPGIVFVVTAGLIVGYSYMDGLGGFSLIDTGIGWQVAWKRFVVVTIGITAAFVAAFLPPESSRYQVRQTLAKTLERLGEVHMELLSYALKTHQKPDLLIVRNLISINTKLRVFLPQRLMTGNYEFKAGPWCKEKYVQLQQIQLEVSDLLSQLMTVYLAINSKWREILLIRTGFLDPHFIGETSAVLWMLANALRHGMPLPAITPCPLVDRFFEGASGARSWHSRGNSRAGSRTPSRTPSRADLKEKKQDTESTDEPSPTENGNGNLTPSVHFPNSEQYGRRSHARSSSSLSQQRERPFPLFTAYNEPLSLELLQDEGYMIFSAGATLSLALCRRIDMLMKVIKELVGENYMVRDLDFDAIEGRYTYHA